MSTTGSSTNDSNKTCRNIAIVFCIIAVIGVIIILSLFIWNFAFRYKGGALSPVECQAANGINLQDFCYVPSTDDLSWQKAEEKCVKSAGHLASIPSDEVNSGVATQAWKIRATATDAWIGLNDQAETYSYKYSDGTNVTYTNFAASTLALSPTDAAARRCITISSGKVAADNATSGQWLKRDCGTAYPYVCRFTLATAPEPPTNVQATPQPGAASVSFAAPSKDGGKPVVNYTVTSWPDHINVTSKQSPILVPGLRPYIKYNFTVVATNVVGASAPSDPSTAIIAGITEPSPPNHVVAQPGDQSVILSFAPPLSDGGAAISQYEITINPGNTKQTRTIAQVNSNTVTATGLTNGNQYTLSLVAINNASKRSVSVTALPVTPSATFPGTPVNFNATAAYTTITLTWSAPTSGPVPTQYNITRSYRPSGENFLPLPDLTYNDTCPCSLTITDNEIDVQYNFFAVSVVAVGASAPTAEVSATPFAIAPGVPQNVVATPADRSALITFTAPADTGGREVDSYTARSNDSSVPDVTLVLSDLVNISTLAITVTNLTAGASYTFTVRAHNLIGDGLFSAPTATIVPFSGSPDPPVNVNAVATGQGANVSWQAGVSDGGSPVRNYTVFAYPGSWNWTTPDNTTTTNFPVGKLLVNINYTFTVTATNDKGASQPSGTSNPVVPFPVVPGPPISVVATAGPQSANVTWQAPTNNGGIPITSYEVVSTPGNYLLNISVNDTTPLWTILTHLWDVSPDYTFKVAASNAVGRGPQSVASVGIKVQATRPDPPLNLKIKAAFSGADVYFTAPLNNGGSSITKYTAVSDPPTSNFDGDKSPISFKELDSKTNYTFVVYAVNAIGKSDASLPSESFQRSTQLLKDLAVPIAGGIILGLLLIVGIIIGVFICKNTEKCCWARDGGSTTDDKSKPAPSLQENLQEEPVKTEAIDLGQSSSGYVETQPETPTQQKAADEV